MSRGTWVRWGVMAALTLGGLTTIGCSNAHDPTTRPSVQSTTAAAGGDSGSSSASLEGVPQPPSSPSPESLAAKKVCPNCGAANDPDAKTCVKCGHKLD